MANIEISSDLLERIREIAQQESRTVEAVVATAIERYVSANEPQVETYDESTDLFHLLIKASEENGWRSGRSDISENFDEIVSDIISEEFLKRRMANDGDQ